MLRLVEPDEIAGAPGHHLPPPDEAEALTEAITAVQRIERSPILLESAQDAARGFRALLESYTDRRAD